MVSHNERDRPLVLSRRAVDRVGPGRRDHYPRERGQRGDQGNSGVCGPSISADGRYVAFYSDADNLVPDDTNFVCDVFVRDRRTGETARVSVDSAGDEGNDEQLRPLDQRGRPVRGVRVGRHQPGPRGHQPGFRRLRARPADGADHPGERGQRRKQGDGDSYCPSISADGRYVAFVSVATNLVPGDTNATSDIFVHDRQTGQTTRVSVDSAGSQGNGDSYYRLDQRGRPVRGVLRRMPPTWSRRTPTHVTDVFVHDRADGHRPRG